MMNQNQQATILPIDRKMLLSIREAAEYSNIGINKIDEMLKQPNCPFVLYVGTKKLVKRKAFEESIEGSCDLMNRTGKIGAHQKHRNLLKKKHFHDRMECRDELSFPALRKGVH